jgi:hypothetical protein
MEIAMDKQITPKDETTLIGCTLDTGFSIRELTVSDDCWGPLWIYGQEFGPTMVVRASTFETAYEIAIDESKTIAPADVPEAYGFDTQDKLAAAADQGEWPELIEGYRHQANCTGTGIVATGHYEWCEELTRETLERFNLRLTIGKED